jgi:hypothetical protein
VIDHGIHQNTYATAVSRINHCTELDLGTERGFNGGPVAGPIAVISVGLPRPLIDAGVDLLHEGRHPDGSDTEAVEVSFLDLLEHSREVSTLEATQNRTILRPAQRAIIVGVAIVEAVDEQEVHGGTIPECNRVSDRNTYSCGPDLIGSRCPAAGSAQKEHEEDKGTTEARMARNQTMNSYTGRTAF